MDLLADRFVLDDDRTALDLATGDRVALTVSCAGGDTDQRRWALACDAAMRWHQPAAPRLIDYGVVGDSRRFEARRIAVCGSDALPMAKAAGLVAIPRAAVTPLGELFERPQGIRPRSVALWGPPGAGKHTIAGDLARIARLHGFVPVAARVLRSVADALRGRSLFVIDDGDEREGWREWLGASLGVSRPHVLLTVSAEAPARIAAVAADRVPADDLIAAVRIEDPAAGPPAAAIRRLAERADGWPGRFAALLWRGLDATDGRPAAGRQEWRAAEQTAVYGSVDQEAPAVAGHGGAWPAPGELALLRRRIQSASRLVGEGRHASAERMFRQTIGALVRRRDWVDAGDGGMALSALLLRRGRPRDAREVLTAAAECWRRTGDEARLVDVAVATGTAWIELARLDEAETTLSAALSAARSLGDERRAARASVALARMLFWRARYPEAAAVMRSMAPGAAEADAIQAASLDVAIAVGGQCLDRAVSTAIDTVNRAARTGDPYLVALSSNAAAFAHLAVGDVSAVDRDVVAAIAAARSAREPLIAVRGRLLLAEALRRAGKRAAASAILHRISRIGSSRLPPILQARCDLLRDLLADAIAPDAVSTRHVTATGLGALALYAGAARASRLDGALDSMVADLVDILDLCQRSDDEHAVLVDVCRRLRRQLHAAGAAVTGGAAGGRTVIASDGGRVDSGAGERAIAAGTTVAPHRHEDRVEAAAPIRYGGAAIGAVILRWTLGTPHELGSAASLMTTVAAVIAPIVSAAAARRQRLAIPALTELIGTSAAIAEVRRGVERAAPAPFAVLIEGESGSGKELVARALHRAGPRRERPFRTLNCAALPDDLVEAELFGHARGAFTGAIGERAGVFEEAHNGTLLLDEIGELSPRAQAKVLRVIQEGELRRIGENTPRRVDVRIVSATNRDLRHEVEAGRFRLDLLYRLDVVRIGVPPLRERREDIPQLADHFWRQAASRVASRATLAPATIAALARYDWPGNIRELQNVLASLVVRSPKRGVVPPTALGPPFTHGLSADASRLDAARRTFEERFVRAALVRTGGHRARAAAELGVTRQGLTKLMTRLGIRSA